MLTRKAIMEIIAFDYRARMGKEYDMRRYGSVSRLSIQLEGSRHKGTPGGGPGLMGFRGCCNMSYYAQPGTLERTFAAEEAANGKPTRKCLRYNYIEVGRQRDPKKREVTIVHVAVRLSRDYKPVVKDVCRFDLSGNVIKYRDIGYHSLGGWVVYWNRKDYDTKSIYSWSCPSALGEWCDEPYRFGGAMTMPWHETVNPEVLAETRYKYAQYTDNGGPGLVSWLKLYQDKPKIEMLAKLGMADLISPALVAAVERKRAQRMLIERAEEFRKASPREAVWMVNHGVTLADARDHFEVVGQLKFHGVPELARIDYERVRKLLKKWGVQPFEYANYLRYSRDAGLDLRNEGTVYPPTGGGRDAFMARLERVEAEKRRVERNRRRAELRKKRIERAAEEKRIAELMKERIVELAAFQDAADRSAVFEGTGYRLVVAKSQEELIQEGKKMGNCVGCGSYGRAIVDGDSLIVMLKDGRGHSYCDIEIDRKTWRVQQCYLKHNQLPPKEIRKMAALLAKQFKFVAKKFNKSA